MHILITPSPFVTTQQINVFWDETPSSPLDSYQSFAGMLPTFSGSTSNDI
jgi:hypothetical protein